MNLPLTVLVIVAMSIAGTPRAQGRSDYEAIRKFEAGALYFLIDANAERGLYIGSTWWTDGEQRGGPLLILTREARELHGKKIRTFEIFVAVDCKSKAVVPRLAFLGDLNDRIARLTDPPLLEVERKKFIDRGIPTIACALSADNKLNWEAAQRSRGEASAFGTIKGFEPGQPMDLVKRKFSLENCQLTPKGSRRPNAFDSQKAVVHTGDVESCAVAAPISRYPELATFAGREVDSLFVESCDGVLSQIFMQFVSLGERNERIFEAFLKEGHFPTHLFVSSGGKRKSKFGYWGQITWRFADWRHTELDSRLIVEGVQEITTFSARHKDCVESAVVGTDLR
jgi:hypothetical protein